MIDFSTLKGLTIPEGNVKQISDAQGNVLWSAITADPIFANNDWETIIAVCQSGKVPDTWVVGNQKAMTIGGTNYTIDIIGKSHDTYADGSGVAPLTFQFHNCFDTKYAMNSTNTSNGGWGGSELRNIHLPSIKALMPSAVQNAIRSVNKSTTAGSQSTEIITTADDLFLLSEVEVFGTTQYSGVSEGSQYEYYKTMYGRSTLKKVSSTVYGWWLRSPRTGVTGAMASWFAFVDSKSDRKMNSTNPTMQYGVSPSFCF